MQVCRTWKNVAINDHIVELKFQLIWGRQNLVTNLMMTVHAIYAERAWLVFE
jgi:hypothetical protein